MVYPIKLEFRNGTSGNWTDWSPYLVEGPVIKRQIESENPGEAGLLVYDSLKHSFYYNNGNPIHNAYSGNLNNVDRFMHRMSGYKSTGEEVTLFEGVADFSTLEYPDNDPSVKYETLDKFSALDEITNTNTQREGLFNALYDKGIYTEVHGDAVVPINISGIGDCWALPSWEVVYTNNAAQPGDRIEHTAPMLEKGDIFQHPDLSGEQKLYVVIDSGLTDYKGVQTTWIKIHENDDISFDPLAIIFWPEAFIPTISYYRKEYYGESYIYLEKEDENGRDVIHAHDGLEIIRSIYNSIWPGTTIDNETGQNEIQIGLSYLTQLLDENPFGEHPLDALKMLADSLRCYLFINKENGHLVLREKSDLGSASYGKVRTVNEKYKLSGKKKYMWDKLVDEVEITVTSAQKDENGDEIQSSVSIQKHPNIKAKNSLKKEIICLDITKSTEEELEDYAADIAQEYFDFYGNRHWGYELELNLYDEILDWELLDKVVINGVDYWMESIEIDIAESTAFLSLVSVDTYDYDYSQAHFSISSSNESTYNSSSSSSRSVATIISNITATDPLARYGSEFSLRYTDKFIVDENGSLDIDTATLGASLYTFNYPLAKTDNVIDLLYNSNNLTIDGSNQFNTIQDIGTSASPQFAGLGLGASADPNYIINGVGDVLLTGNMTVMGNIYQQGTNYAVDAEHVYVTDNMLYLNNGETGAGVTNGISGIEVDRGPEPNYTNYQFIFSDLLDTFRVGESGDTQAVATREDTPTVNSLSYWNDTAKRFDSLSDFIYSSNELLLDYNIGTSNYISQLIGWKITNAGNADFRYVYVDELRAKAFTADVTQLLFGSDKLTKSGARLYQEFTIPIDAVVDSDSTQIIVEDLEGFTGYRVFEDGDYIHFRVFDTSGNGLIIANMWGTVEFDLSYGTSGFDGNSGTQAYTLTYKYFGNADARGLTIPKGSWIEDLGHGQDGGGYIERTTVDLAGSPYTQLVVWDVTPYDPNNLKVLYRLGVLTGVTDSDFGGSLSGHGIYFNEDANIYIKGNYIAKSSASIDLLDNSIMIGNITGVANNALKIAQTGVNSTSGYFLYDDESNEIMSFPLSGNFRLGKEGGSKLVYDVDSGQLTLKGVVRQSLDDEDVVIYTDYRDRGEWVFGREYKVNDLVRHGIPASTYICVTDNAGTINTTPGFNDIYWNLFAEAGDQGIQGIQGYQGAGAVYRGEWNSTATYYASQDSGNNYYVRKDIVLYSGQYWICKQTHTNHTPASGTYWEAFGATFSSVATGLLLTEDANITQTLVMGTGNSHGVIRSESAATLLSEDSGFYMTGDNGHVRFGRTNGSGLEKGFLWNNDNYYLNAGNKLKITSEDSQYWNYDYSQLKTDKIITEYYSTSFETDLDGWEAKIQPFFGGNRSIERNYDTSYSGTYCATATFNSWEVTPDGYEQDNKHVVGALIKEVPLSTSGQNKTYFVRFYARLRENTLNDVNTGLGIGVQLFATSGGFGDAVKMNYYTLDNIDGEGYWQEISFYFNTSLSSIKLFLCLFNSDNSYVLNNHVISMDIDDVVVYESESFTELTSTGFYAYRSLGNYVKISDSISQFKGVDIDVNDAVVRGNLIIEGNLSIVTGEISASPPGYSPSSWNTAYGWGDHSTFGYITASDTLVSNRVSLVTGGTTIKSSNITGEELNTLDGIDTDFTIQSQINNKEPNINNTGKTSGHYWDGTKNWQVFNTSVNAHLSGAAPIVYNNGEISIQSANIVGDQIVVDNGNGTVIGSVNVTLTLSPDITLTSLHTGSLTVSNLSTGLVQSNSSGSVSSIIGTANYLPKWNSSSLTNSSLSDSGTLVVSESDFLVQGYLRVRDASSAQSTWYDNLVLGKLYNSNSGVSVTSTNDGGGSGHFRNKINRYSASWTWVTTSPGNPNVMYLGAGSGSNNILRLFDATGSDDTDINIQIQSNGKSFFNGGSFGIGTTSPRDLFDVAGGQVILDNNKGIRFNDTGDTQPGASLYRDTSNHISLRNTLSDRGIAFKTGGDVTRAMLDQTGKLGIGTVSPSKNIHLLTDGQSVVRIQSTATSISNDAAVQLKSPAYSDDNFYTYIESMDNTGHANWTIGYKAPANTVTFNTNGFNERMRIDGSGRVGIGRTPSHILDVNGDMRVSGSIFIDEDKTYIGYEGAGGFGQIGSYRIDRGITTAGRSTAFFDDLWVRGNMHIEELRIHQVRATNGSLFVTSSGKISKISDNEWTTDDPSNTNLAPFIEGDLIYAKKVYTNGIDSLSIKRIIRKVTNVSGKVITVEIAGVPDIGEPEVGDELVRIGNTTDLSRQGSVYMTSDDIGAPYIRISDNVDSWDKFGSYDTLKVQLGNLSSITDSIYGSLKSYGLYSQNIYMKGNVNIAGTLTAGDSNGFGNTFYAGRINKNLFYEGVSSSQGYNRLAHESATQVSFINPLGSFESITALYNYNGGNAENPSSRFGGRFTNLKPYTIYTYSCYLYIPSDGLQWVNSDGEFLSEPLESQNNWYQPFQNDSGDDWGASLTDIELISDSNYDLEKKDTWQRISITFKTGDTVNYPYVSVVYRKGTNEFKDGDESGDSYYWYVYGAQLEEGEHVTGYQPTDGNLISSYGEEIILNGDDFAENWDDIKDATHDNTTNEGKITVTASSESANGANQSLTGKLFIGKRYRLSIASYGSLSTGSPRVVIWDAGYGSLAADHVFSETEDEVYTTEFTFGGEEGGSIGFRLLPGTNAGETAVFDKISLREVLTPQYGMWSISGGFGGTIQNPVVSIANYGMSIRYAGYSTDLLDDSIMLGNITGSASSAIKITETGIDSTSGIFGYNSSGTEVFTLRRDGTVNIVGSITVTGGNAATQSYADGVGNTALSSAQDYTDSLRSTLDTIFGNAVTSGTTIIAGGYFQNNLINTDDLFAQDILASGSINFLNPTFGAKGIQMQILDQTGDPRFYVGNGVDYFEFDGQNAIFSGSITAESVVTGIVRGGRTSYAAPASGNAGYWLGNDSGAYKFQIVKDANTFFDYSGSDFTMKGGEIIGSVFSTATTGKRIVLSNNQINFYDSSGSFTGGLYGANGIIEYEGRGISVTGGVDSQYDGYNVGFSRLGYTYNARLIGESVEGNRGYYDGSAWTYSNWRLGEYGLKFGAGTSTISYDVNLYREDSNELKTDNNFDALSYKVSGTEIIDSSGNIKPAGTYKSSSGSAGYDGEIALANGETLLVESGLIIDIY